MTRNKTIAAVIVAALVGMGLGAGSASSGATPTPTPVMITKTVQATPQVVVVQPDPVVTTVTVTPPVCLDALNQFNTIIGAENSILLTLADGGNVTQAQINAVANLDVDKAYADADNCRMAANP